MHAGKARPMYTPTRPGAGEREVVLGMIAGEACPTCGDGERCASGIQGFTAHLNADAAHMTMSRDLTLCHMCG